MFLLDGDDASSIPDWVKIPVSEGVAETNPGTPPYVKENLPSCATFAHPMRTLIARFAQELSEKSMTYTVIV